MLSDVLGSLEGERVADLFSGSGVWGISLLSHGADRVEFFEGNRSSSRLIASALEDLGAPQRSWEVVPGPLPHTLEARGPYTLVVCDPPYSSLGLGREVVAEAAGRIASGGRLIVRWPGSEHLDSPYNGGSGECRVMGRDALHLFGAP